MRTRREAQSLFMVSISPFSNTDPKTKVKRGIIRDLECAKKTGTGASSDIRSVRVSTFGYEILLTLKIRVRPFLWLTKL